MHEAHRQGRGMLTLYPKEQERILFISDTHRGAKYSDFKKYEPQVLAKMREYDHVVLAGDIFELWFLGAQNGEKPKEILRNAIGESKEWLEDFLKENPHVQVHFVLGNHENLRKFRNSLDRLQQKYGNFEWHPEAVRIGDALIVHGDLQMDNKTDRTRRIDRLRDVHKGMNIYDRVVSNGEKYMQRLYFDYTHGASWVVPRIWSWLKERDAQRDGLCMHSRTEETLSLEGAKHVFFGHTHVKFHTQRHLDEQGRDVGIAFHNTGSFTSGNGKRTDWLGMLEAKLVDGAVKDVSPVALTPHKEWKHRLPPRSDKKSGESQGR